MFFDPITLFYINICDFDIFKFALFLGYFSPLLISYV